MRMKLIKAHGEKGSRPFSFERLPTSPPQADHVLVDLFFICVGRGWGWGVALKPPPQGNREQRSEEMERGIMRKKIKRRSLERQKEASSVNYLVLRLRAIVGVSEGKQSKIKEMPCSGSFKFK